jgi:hypothetical protein
MKVGGYVNEYPRSEFLTDGWLTPKSWSVKYFLNSLLPRFLVRLRARFGDAPVTEFEADNSRGVHDSELSVVAERQDADGSVFHTPMVVARIFRSI